MVPYLLRRTRRDASRQGKTRQPKVDDCRRGVDFVPGDDVKGWSTATATPSDGGFLFFSVSRNILLD